MSRRPRLNPVEKARNLLVLQATFVVMHGLRATPAELSELRRRAAIAEPVADDALLAALCTAAMACVAADPLTDDLLTALDAAIKAVQPPREPRAVQHHSWMDRGDLV